MISSVSFHPFISHFPPALFVAGVTLLFLAEKKNLPIYKTAGSFNLSLGLLAAVMADFSGMLSTDLGLRTALEVEGHQGYAFLFTILYGFCTGYSYTQPHSRTARLLYGCGLLAMGASAWTGYQLVF
ncbi:hypothetical protein MNBD_NITROSPINAE05-947 [hydrothermal vent metagenome]|uniref:DUF2231 domain-containing protein n=1 Tax=hydrothermal vent metagenome TaxID=652676 RepID=A0A3B1CFF7_9ZZZZ